MSNQQIARELIPIKKFEAKVKTMSAHDIIMAMVEGLRKPRTEINMGYFGYMRESDGVCFGCAATNAVLHIMDADREEVEYYVANQPFPQVPELEIFEYAIDYLRSGSIDLYNQRAAEIGLAQITHMPGQYLPHLVKDYTEEQLQQYEKLAEYQLTVKQ